MYDRESSVNRSRDSTSMDSLVTADTSDSPAPQSPPGKHWRLPDQLAEPSKPKPPTSQCLDNQVYHAVTNGLYFQNALEAQRPMSSLQWHAPANDVSIPHTEEEDRWVVAQLVCAIKNMSEAKDTAGSAYRRRFTPPDSYYKDWAIEACAWDVLAIAKGIHMQGFTSRLYDAALVDTIGETQHWHFEDRIGWICLALRSSKNVAVNLMKKEKIMTIVGAPHKLHKATMVNTKSNANRAVWVQNGRDADIEHRDRPFKKRTDHNGIPMPLPKRHKMDEEDAEKTTDNSVKKTTRSRKGRNTRNASFSPYAQSLSPDTRVENGTSPRTSHAVSGSHPTPRPMNFNNVALRPIFTGSTLTPMVPGGTFTPIAAPTRSNNGDKDFDMADAPYQPMTSFSLDAINRRINDESEAGSGNRRSSSRNDRDTVDTPTIAVRSSTEREACLSDGDALGNYDADVNNATTDIVAAAASTSPSKSAPVVKAENIVEMHDAAEIDAAHVLTSMQRGSAP